jgi:topoisomerase IA-like protein
LQEDASGDKDKTVFYGWPEGVQFTDITEEDVIEFIETEGKKALASQLGEYNGFPVIRKKGKFGIYAEWNGKTTSCTMEDSLEVIIEKLNKIVTNVLRVVGQFEIRTGPYGPYMFKKDITGPKRKFVGIPNGVNIQAVTETDLVRIFQEELKKKARSGSYGYKKGLRQGDGKSKG